MSGILRRLAWVPLTLWVGVAGAQDMPVVIEVAQIETIRAAQGKVATVRGVVERTSKSQGSGINIINFFGGEFAVVVFAKNLKNFPDGEPADTLEGELVEVRGTIGIYEEKLQIVVANPEQIVRLDPATKKPYPAPVEVVVKPVEKSEPEASDPVPDEKEDDDKIDPRLYFDDP